MSETVSGVLTGVWNDAAKLFENVSHELSELSRDMSLLCSVYLARLIVWRELRARRRRRCAARDEVRDHHA